MFKNKALIPIFIVVFVDLLGFTIVLPLLPFYAQDYQASPQVIGYFVAVYSVMQFIASPILGGLSDKYGRRPVLIYSQLGSLIGFLMLGFARSLWMLFASRIIDGASGGNLTIAQAYIADVTEPEDRAASFAVIGIAFGLGFMIGPLVGGELTGLWGRSAPAFAAAGMSAASTLLTLFYLKEPARHASVSEKTGLSYYVRALDYFKDKNLRTYLAIFFFFALPFSLYVSMFSLYAKLELSFTEKDVGRFLAYAGFLGIIYQGAVIRPLVKKIGELTSLRLGMICCTIGLVLLVFAANWWQLGLVSILLSFGTGITRPVLSSLVTQVAPPNRKGGVIGVATSIESFTRILAPIAGGWIIGGLHPNYIGYVGATLSMIGVILAFFVHNNLKTLSGDMIID